MISRIFVDLDDVLVDFRGGAIRLHGWDPADCRPEMWDMCESRGVTQEDFWKPIDEAGEDFWYLLQPHPWIHEVIELVERHVGEEWYIVTSPSRHVSSYVGKLKWVKAWFGAQFDRMIPMTHKHLLADYDRVLIDDSPDNILEFNNAGGIGILFPNVGNSLHEQAHSPMDHVEEILTRIMQQE